VRSVTGRDTHIEEVQGWVVEMKEAFRAALFDDLNMPAALACVFRLVRQINHVIGQGKMCADCAKTVLDAMAGVDQVLGLLPPEQAPAELPEQIALLIAQREQARKDRAFERADQLRQELLSMGYVLEDRIEGTRVRRK
jgi:cysteinyl-tRNA synthetase